MRSGGFLHRFGSLRRRRECKGIPDRTVGVCRHRRRLSLSLSTMNHLLGWKAAGGGLLLLLLCLPSSCLPILGTTRTDRRRGRGRGRGCRLELTFGGRRLGLGRLRAVLCEGLRLANMLLLLLLVLGRRMSLGLCGVGGWLPGSGGGSGSPPLSRLLVDS